MTSFFVLLVCPSRSILAQTISTELLNCSIHAGLSSALVSAFSSPEKNTIHVVHASATSTAELCPNHIMFEAEPTWLHSSRAVLYAFCIIYCFVGLATITNLYMEARSSMQLHSSISHTIQCSRNNWWHFGLILALNLPLLGEVCLSYLLLLYVYAGDGENRSPNS